jgi:exopolysaccharide biosynthesis polyprenyl glycosylphosphotransferase
MFYRLKQLIILGGDVTALYIGLYLGVTLRYLNWGNNKFIELITAFTPLFLIALLIFFISGLYDIGRLRNTLNFFQHIGVAAIIWFSLAVLFFYTNPNTTVTPKTTLLLTTICAFILISLWRAFYNYFLSTNFLSLPIIFAGLTPAVKEIITTIHNNPERGFTVEGIITDTPDANIACAQANSYHEVLIKNNNRLAGLLVVSPSHAENKILQSELYQAMFAQVSIVPLAEFYEDFFKRIPPFTFSEAWFVTHLNEQRKKMYDRFRILLDYATALIMGAFFIVTFPFIALIIRLTSPGPIMFTQERVGRSKQIFSIYKYRTMKALAKDGSAETGGPQFASIHDVRITPFGSFLRRTRLDELPQFINILKGEMGIIGPRPERPEFVDELTRTMPYYALRHLIKPGMTGWAQLQQSYYGTIEENLVKLEYDLYYIKNRNLILDIAILLRTVNIVLRFMGR